MIKFYNSLSKKKEVFKSIKKNEVKMYTCGPTVYDFAHIGNFRAYIFEDLLRRYLKFSGFKVVQVMNLTDVDDKTIKGAIKEGIPLEKFTDKFKKAFFDDIKSLNIEKAEFYPEATKTIPEMVALIKKLLKKGLAYRGEDNCIYFSIKKFKNYGKLSGFKICELKDGARVCHDEYEKENARDFALWKAYSEEDGNVFWETELGKGRPGWHIECSAMSMKFLGESFDLHTGGIDNKFPHHENEIAQSEGATGKKFVNYWLHCSHLIVDGQKMSKSLGNFFTLRDLFKKGHSPTAIRFLLLSTHYRSELNFTEKNLTEAKSKVDRLNELISKLNEIKTDKGNSVDSLLKKIKNNFQKALDDDLNISLALTFLFDFVRETNKLIDESKLSEKEAIKVLSFLKEINFVLGVMNFEEEKLDNELMKLIDEREKARKERNWIKADEIRDKLKLKGIELNDTKDGVRWKKV
ncbi:MAG: cysteine--tRNA ligase [Candidatus Micrarchaeota archaeon]